MDEDRTRRDARNAEPPGGREFPARQARQGRKGIPVLWVLIGGLVLAAVVWALVEFYGEGIQDESREIDAGGPSVGETAPQDPSALPPAGQN